MKTPRTDAEILTDNEYLMENIGLVDFVRANFARKLETELSHALAAANIQAGVFEQTVAENQELRQQIDNLTQALEKERSTNSKRHPRKNVTLEIRKCAERIAKIGDTCACGRLYTTKHHGCSDRFYFVCEPCGKEILIG